MSSRQYYSQHSFSNESKILPYIISKNKLPVQLCFGVSQSNEYTSFFRKIGLATVSSNKASSRKLPVDLVINLKQESFSLIKPISILFHEVHIDHYPHKDKLSLREQLVLQNHFRRIQQHSLVAGQFLGLQAQQLDQPIDLWRTIGILHDIDYARAYSDMDQHGFLSEPILFKYKFDEKICNCIKFHNTLAFQNSSDLLEQSVFFSGRFLKQMVHASRVSGRKIQEFQLDD